MLETIESEKKIDKLDNQKPQQPKQTNGKEIEELIKSIEAINPDELTPKKALDILFDLKKNVLQIKKHLK